MVDLIGSRARQWWVCTIKVIWICFLFLWEHNMHLLKNSKVFLKKNKDVPEGDHRTTLTSLSCRFSVAKKTSPSETAAETFGAPIAAFFCFPEGSLSLASSPLDSGFVGATTVTELGGLHSRLTRHNRTILSPPAVAIRVHDSLACSFSLDSPFLFEVSGLPLSTGKSLIESSDRGSRSVERSCDWSGRICRSQE